MIPLSQNLGKSFYVKCQCGMYEKTWYSLLGYFAANPFVFWSWLMWVAKGIHDDVCLGPRGFRVG